MIDSTEAKNEAAVDTCVCRCSYTCEKEIHAFLLEMTFLISLAANP